MLRSHNYSTQHTYQTQNFTWCVIKPACIPIRYVLLCIGPMNIFCCTTEAKSFYDKTHAFVIATAVSHFTPNEQKTAIFSTMEHRYCVVCSRYFASRDALEQHERDSPMHNKTFHCHDCNLSFGSNKILKNHRKFCQAAFNSLLDPVNAPLCEGQNEGVSSNTCPRSPTVDPRSLLLERLSRMIVPATLPMNTTR
jgi:hypothetical protein